ncbi:MAG: DEAD/DEAH box helicase family protein, partial [Armatimonadetes bacterium]|nr:DEAD/DEAH box helicase family protein [Armatimonadota bacterium]
MGLLGSGNFTRPGLTQNIELNVELTTDQTTRVKQWFEDRWEEAVEDDVTAIVKQEIKRQLDLYDPYVIYQKALLIWGRFRQGDIHAEPTLDLRNILDPHQEQGYRQALQILERENGVMICDGVGLGKSFIALALMEHFCSRKKNVLLIAPKSIMESSWRVYLETYLSDFRQPFGTIYEKNMTDFGFGGDEVEEGEEGEEPPTKTDTQRQNERDLQKLVERSDVVVVDESHNFRSSISKRYKNLFKITAPIGAGNQKKVILLTATPVNTSYTDLGAQLELITHSSGTIVGYDALKIRSATKELDKSKNGVLAPQFSLDLRDCYASDTLDRVLESILIQRKRTTCIDLAKAVNKQLMFPIREKPTVIEYELGDAYRKVVAEAQRRFEPIAGFLAQVAAAYKKAEETGEEFVQPKPPSDTAGIKFAGFMPHFYQREKKEGGRSYQVEAFLARMVFINTLKQLESSPPAFQGILQSLGTSLVARLKHVFGDEAELDIAPHLDWVRAPINRIESEGTEGTKDEGEAAEINGTELDGWLERAIDQRHLHKKLADFKAEDYDVNRWRVDIVRDLGFLAEIHRETIEARKAEDLKFEQVVKLLENRLERGQRTVVFTQSQRTAFYLEHELRGRFPEHDVARIDSNVKQETRASVLYAFCPKYNPR